VGSIQSSFVVCGVCIAVVVVIESETIVDVGTVEATIVFEEVATTVEFLSLLWRDVTVAPVSACMSCVSAASAPAEIRFPVVWLSVVPAGSGVHWKMRSLFAAALWRSDG
jgi:hypothetical protein